MEIVGELKEIHPDRLCVLLSEKNQEIDVFYTPSRLSGVKWLVVRERVKLNLILQTVKIGNDRLAKFWLHFIISPTPPKPKSRGKGEGDFDWSKNRGN